VLLGLLMGSFLHRKTCISIPVNCYAKTSNSQPNTL
jgi:hypothetical protein